MNVALPSIQDDLGFSQSLAWVVNAYLIAFGGLLLLAGRLGDLIGARTSSSPDLAVFRLASLLCGFAQSEAMLVAARFVQGIGGAMTSAVVLGMIVTMFPEPREQAKAIGVYAFVASAGGRSGCSPGGVLTQATAGIGSSSSTSRSASHRHASAAARPRPPPRSRQRRRRPRRDPDHGALMLGVYTIVEPAAEDGWGAPLTLGSSAASLALLGAFIARESTHPTRSCRCGSSVPQRLGREPIQALTVAGMFGLFFLGSSTCRRCWATTRSRSASPSCRRRW